MAHVQIFLSTVSAEFRSYRDALRRDLDRPNVTVKVQEDFIATGTETLDKLDEYIRQCRAVIHLVGDMTGALAQAPSVAVIRQRYPDLAQRLPVLAPFLDPGGPALSYTQWEAWLALYHSKVLIIAVPQEGAPRDERYRRDEEQRAAQQAHLSRLAKVERYPEIHFANADRLAVEVLRSSLQQVLLSASVLDEPKPSLDSKWLESHLQHVQDAFVDHLRKGEELTPEQADARYLDLLVQVRRNEKLLSEHRQRDDDKPKPEVGPVADFLQHDCVGILVFGEGGTGKTTSILKLAADAARRALTDAKQPIPFYIKLNLFDSREHGIKRLLDLFSNGSHLEPDNMEALWRTGSRSCIFFMDGFNEVEPDCQEACALALQEFIHRGIHRYVVTSRLNTQIAGLPAQVAGTVTLDIVQLDEYQIRDFLIRHGAAGLYEQMDYRLKGLARNPFLLWAMAQSCAGLATKDLPRNRGQLYCNLIDHYIFVEREQNKLPPPTEYNFLLVKKSILSRLAFGMKQEGITRRLEDLTLLDTVRAQLREIRTRYEGLIPIKPHKLMPDPPIAKAILDEMVENNVLRRVGEAVEFMHESVQDYFAAAYLSSLGLEHPEVRECLRYDSWDDAVILLAGLLDDAGALIELLAPLDPFLAVQCARQAERVGPAALEALQAQLKVKLASRYESERRNAQKAQEELTVLMRPPVVLSVEESSFYEKIRRDSEKQQAERWTILRDTQYRISEMQSSINQALVPPPELIAELKTREVTHLVQLLVVDGTQRPTRTLFAAEEVLRSLPMERVIPALLEGLRAPATRHRVAGLMGQLPSVSVLPHMGPLLVDQDAAVREAAVGILEALKDKSAIPRLILLLEDANPRVRRRVVLALGTLQAEHVVPLLFPLLRDKEPIPTLETPAGMFEKWSEYVQGDVPRIAAAEVLEKLVTEKHLALLSSVLLDDDPDVYNAAFDIFQAVRRRLHLPKDYRLR